MRTLSIIVAILAVGAFVVGCHGETNPAAQKTDQTTPAAAAAAPEQTVCPVMGGAIDKDIYTDYNGRRVYFCCPGCEGTFLKDPEKYLAKIDAAVQPE